MNKDYPNRKYIIPSDGRFEAFLCIQLRLVKVWLHFNFLNINQNTVRLVKVLLEGTCISKFENLSIYERS